MGKFTYVVILASFALLCILKDNQANAECCPRRGGGYCDDGTIVGPIQCCAHGPCNFWCCNCDNGCRTRDDMASVLTGRSTSMLETLDLDHDGHFDRDEARMYVLSINGGDETKLADLEKHFVHFDKNGDGKLSFDEIEEK